MFEELVTLDLSLFVLAIAPGMANVFAPTDTCNWQAWCQMNFLPHQINELCHQ